MTRQLLVSMTLSRLQNVEHLCRLAAQREVTVSFASEVQPGLNWTFKPCQKRIKVRPGQSTLVFYTASNNSNEDITGVSTYNVTPGQVQILPPRVCSLGDVAGALVGTLL